jgi:hypothetical protein
MELPEVLHELWPRLFAQRFERSIKIVASIGLGFVVLGVAGELTFEHWRSGYEGLLENFENILLVDAERHVALTQQEAGDAATSAKTAHDEADTVKTEADALKIELSGLEFQAEQLRNALGDSVFQGTDEVRNLSRFEHVQVRVEYLLPSCGRCAGLATNIAITLHDVAWWGLTSPVGSMREKDFGADITVQAELVNDGSRRYKNAAGAADALVKELNRQNIKAVRLADAGGENTLRIRVGRKSPPLKKP